MNTPVKLLIGFGSVGGIAGGSIALSNYLSQEDSIQKQLENEGFRILEKTSGEWDSILVNYQTAIKADLKLKFSGAEVSSKEDLQKKCEETLNKNASENNDTNNYLKKAKKWCIVPTTVSVALTNKTILRTDGTKDDEDQEDWNKKILAYVAKENTNTIANLDLKNPPITGKVAITKQHRQSIKDACAKLNNKKSYEADYEKAIEQSKTWCTKDG